MQSYAYLCNDQKSHILICDILAFVNFCLDIICSFCRELQISTIIMKINFLNGHIGII